MKKMIIAGLLALSCATTAVEERSYNADGTARPLKSEMSEGVRQCQLMCTEVGMKFREYRDDGKCVCTRAEVAPKE